MSIQMQFPFGYPPKDDVEQAALVIKQYRDAGMLDEERSEMLIRYVHNGRAVLDRLVQLIAESP